MVDSQLQLDLVRHLQQLTLAGQRKVLEFAKSLVESTPSGTSGRDLITFAGAIPPDDCSAIAGAIEAGCEQVDPHGW